MTKLINTSITAISSILLVATAQAGASTYETSALTTTGTSAGVVKGITDSTKGLAKGLIQTPGRALKVGNTDLPMLEAGVQEFSLNGNLSDNDDLIYNLNLRYGWFVSDALEIGLGAGIQGVDSDMSFSAEIFGQYNFATGTKWVPFVGASVGWAELDSDAFSSSSITVGVNAGVRYFIRSNVAVSVSAGGDFLLDAGPSSDDFSREVTIGTSFYF